MRTRNLFWGTVLALVPVALFAQNDYQAAVDAQRLNTADEQNDSWLSYGRTYDEQRYSPLDQINRETVSDLALSWSADMTTSRGQEATPVVVDGAFEPLFPILPAAEACCCSSSRVFPFSVPVCARP